MFNPTWFRPSTQRLVFVLCWLAGGAAGTLLAMDSAPQAIPRPAKQGSVWMRDSGASGHLILTPDDTYLTLDGANYSRSDVLATYTWPDKKVANAIVMKFDLAAVPAGAVVTGAALHMALLDADKGPEATYVMGAHRILHGNLDVGGATGLTRDGVTPWTPTDCCFNAFPVAQADISPPLDRSAIDKAPGFKSWTVTAMVRQWMADPSSNFGLLLNSDPTRRQDRFRIFASADHPATHLRPYLSIAFRGGKPDRTQPEVAITSPEGGATVSGAVPITASASDDVGVAGVRFLVDNKNIGGEDTTAPYDVTWDTSSVAAGTYAVTAIARDAAGNTRSSAIATLTVSHPSSAGGGGGGAPPPAPPPPPPPGGRVVFSSSWDTATGNTQAAVGDGGRWANTWEFNHGSGVQLMSVVAGGPNGRNALRVQQRGSSYAANVQIDNFLPESTDFYLRYYMRNDDTSSAGDHIVTADTYQYANLTYMRKMGGPSGWDFVMSLYGCGYTYPIGHWGPAMKMQNGAWYRFEYFVDFVAPNRVQVHPRVYDASGNLILSDEHFRQSDFGSTPWNGRSDWTLASYYAAGHSFCVDPQWLNDFGLGNNGQQGAGDTGQYWYFSGVEIRTDGWAGAMGPAASVLSAVYWNKSGANSAR